MQIQDWGGVVGSWTLTLKLPLPRKLLQFLELYSTKI